ncbi:hypothetical protein TBLA_0C00370 [Henningerozyma blattae CBS 6284]|uniref:Ubiquitin thioesterase OTU n=1 Tax=Henningerozyma blattae (strain ATCC 34711 / CBS 6284 / DSM 70876 / NBRC 10599 / NRRL Y-10934 / UCD 77-7) TaxID=1071380 RepID=I2H0F1_HENB6|nr:hypothetical protein TBLA_0C00370 [Tetrapisispora blattae CBS 6284]CCH59853.1 hypothetical protein TBLA_0C00370 [Tetrapisispora blattae CBS 6284]
MRIKVTLDGKSSVLKLDDSSTGEDLLMHIKQLNPEWDEIKNARFGYPPKNIKMDDPAVLSQTIKKTGISNGDNLMLTSIKSSAVTSTPDDHGKNVVRIHKVPEDNSCLFHSLSYCLNKNLDRSQQLRKNVATRVMEDPVTYSTAILGGKTPKQYAEWIQRTDTWGGGVELSILCNKLQMAVYVIDASSSKLSLTRFDNEMEKSVEYCILIYTGVHYDPVEFQKFDQKRPTTCFPVKDTQLLDFMISESKKLADALRIAGGTFDTGKAAIVCNICGTKMNGEREASQHAEVTGHVDMQQVRD